ncbi:MAG: hypothetical protein K8H86_02810 [Ignavibacteriaceae bacterium]|nr:hypothetical protein [Ignavibacteriaceae bacterium]
MKKTLRFFFVLLLVAFASGTLIAQSDDLGVLFSEMSQDAVTAYTRPIISGFGSNLNTGWVAKAPSDSKFDFHLDIKFLGMGSFFGSADKTFETTGMFRFTSNQADQILAASGISTSNFSYSTYKNTLLNTDWTVNMSGPTILGKEGEVLNVEFQGTVINGQPIKATKFSVNNVSGFLKDLSVLPMAAFQITGGTFYGTDVSLRFFPSISLGDLGKFSFFGIGFVHNPGVWLKNPLPLNVGVGFFTQTMKVGDIFSSTANQFGLYASKTFGAGISVTPYTSLTVESSTTTLQYAYEYDTAAGHQKTDLKFDLEGDNGVGFTIGAAFSLAIVNLNIDYKLAKTSTASAALVFGF